MKIAVRFALLLAVAMPAPASAQDPGMAEVVITGTRRESDGFDASRPVIGLRRTADFAILEVSIAGDTREAPRRREEIATGDFIITPLTLANYRNLPMSNDGRPDTDRVSFLIKARLDAATDGAAAQQRIERFVHAVPAAGRAEFRAGGELTLSVVAPDQYRGQILDLIAADSRAAAQRFGPDYAVEARGLDRPVEWARASLTEVFLYVPYNIVVRPKT
jgi:hypothetical protein